jgi:hypothetical protein
MRLPRVGERGWCVPADFSEQDALHDVVTTTNEPIPGYPVLTSSLMEVDGHGMREITVIIEAG